MRFASTMAAISCLLVVTACGSPVLPSPTGSSGPVPSAGPSASIEPAGAVSVVLGLYSGRSDPEWTLTAEQAATVGGLLAALPDSSGTPPVGGLGYHGFTILLPGGALVAFRGVVAPPGDGQRTVKVDPNQTIERYLLETSRPHVTAGEFAAVERDLRGP